MTKTNGIMYVVRRVPALGHHEWSDGAGMKGREKRKIPEETRRFPNSKIRSNPAGDCTRIALVGGEHANRSATAAPQRNAINRRRHAFSTFLSLSYVDTLTIQTSIVMSNCDAFMEGTGECTYSVFISVRHAARSNGMMALGAILNVSRFYLVMTKGALMAKWRFQEISQAPGNFPTRMHPNAHTNAGQVFQDCIRAVDALIFPTCFPYLSFLEQYGRSWDFSSSHQLFTTSGVAVVTTTMRQSSTEENKTYLDRIAACIHLTGRAAAEPREQQLQLQLRLRESQPQHQEETSGVATAATSVDSWRPSPGDDAAQTGDTASFTSLGRYSLGAGVDRSLVRDLGHPDDYQLACGGSFQKCSLYGEQPLRILHAVQVTALELSDDNSQKATTKQGRVAYRQSVVIVVSQRSPDEKSEKLLRARTWLAVAARKAVGLTKVRLEDCLRCDACSCIYLDQSDYDKHMRNFHRHDSPKKHSQVSMEQRRNERARETGDPREISSTSGISRHDSHMQRSGVTRPVIEPGSSWWEASTEVERRRIARAREAGSTLRRPSGSAHYISHIQTFALRQECNPDRPVQCWDTEIGCAQPARSVYLIFSLCANPKPVACRLMHRVNKVYTMEVIDDGVATAYLLHDYQVKQISCPTSFNCACADRLFTQKRGCRSCCRYCNCRGDHQHQSIQKERGNNNLFHYNIKVHSPALALVFAVNLICTNEPSQHSPGVISVNHGIPKSRLLDRESNPFPPECESSVLPLRATRTAVVWWFDYSSPTGFSRGASFPPPYYSGSASSSRRFTLFGSQEAQISSLTHHFTRSMSPHTESRAQFDARGFSQVMVHVITKLLCKYNGPSPCCVQDYSETSKSMGSIACSLLLYSSTLIRKTVTQFDIMTGQRHNATVRRCGNTQRKPTGHLQLCHVFHMRISGFDSAGTCTTFAVVGSEWPKTVDRWTKMVSRRLNSDEPMQDIKQDPDDCSDDPLPSVDFSHLLSQVEVKIKTEPAEDQEFSVQAETGEEVLQTLRKVQGNHFLECCIRNFGRLGIDVEVKRNNRMPVDEMLKLGQLSRR
ncbi:hypothetical protein PR048_015253 [Dryococelus australis]|uniref:C2H2-type domain-containing protein n=1 Tax=Dryococelus australis TaxID=614101 RepID=A0ABQ9HGF4_9NEOP|nr:hypothetical protein PR048_015253 [Dryococelus australis]